MLPSFVLREGSIIPKRRLVARIDEEIWFKLQEYIKQAYSGSVYGALSIEVQNALAEYLRVKHAQIHTKPLNPTIPKIHQACACMVQKLKDEGFINQVSRQVLSGVIAEVRGADERTVTKWTKILVKNGYLKIIGTYTYEIL